MAVAASGSEDASFPGDDLRGRPDLQQRMHTIRDVGVARFAERGDPPVTHADVALNDPPVVEDDGVRDDEVRTTIAAGRRPLLHRLPDRLPASEPRLVAADAMVLLDLDPEVGIGQPNLVAGGRSVELRVALAGDPHRNCPSRRSPGTRRRPASSTSSTSRTTPGSKRTDVPAGTSRRKPTASPRGNESAGLAWAKRSEERR